MARNIDKENEKKLLKFLRKKNENLVKQNKPNTKSSGRKSRTS
jgi:hypothetical protein